MATLGPILQVLIVSTYFCCTSTAFLIPTSYPLRGRAQPSECRQVGSSRSGADGDPVLRLPLMEAELATLADAPNQERIELERAIDDARTAAEFGVRRAQVDFYEAFSSSNLDAMGAIWSTESHVRCVHPGLASFEGREDVMQSWSQIFSQGDGFTIKPSRSRIDICGQTAFCSCIEETPNGGRLEALNVYRREGGGWRMTLHMASPIIAMPSPGSLDE